MADRSISSPSCHLGDLPSLSNMFVCEFWWVCVWGRISDMGFSYFELGIFGLLQIVIGLDVCGGKG